MNKHFLLFLILISLNGNIFGGPQLQGESAIAIDMETGEIIYAREIDKKMYPASLTKLLTAVLLAENKNSDDTLSYSEAAKAVYPFKLDLDIGEKMVAADAMDAILLFSANDIAWMIAENISGSVENFAGLMNKKAAELGLKHSRFITPSGLHHQDHYSTAYDLTILLRTAYQYPWLRQSMGKVQHTIVTRRNSQLEIKNRNKLLLTAGCIGGKTGWTPEAGRCLAALFSREERLMAGVVLNSEYDHDDTVVFYDMVNLMDWAYAQKRDVLYQPGEIVHTIDAVYNVIPFLGPQRPLAIPFTIRQTVSEYTADPGLLIKIKLDNISPWRLRRNISPGKLIIQGREISHSYDLFPTISALDLLKQNLLFYSFMTSAVIFLVTLTFLLLALGRKKKQQTRITRAQT